MLPALAIALPEVLEFASALAVAFGAKKLLDKNKDDTPSLFGSSGENIIIEEFLEGEEISFFALVDTNGFILPLTTAQDHKKIGEGDVGPNTGGMGAYSPVPFIKHNHINDFVEQFVKPIINDLKK